MNHKIISTVENQLPFIIELNGIGPEDFTVFYLKNKIQIEDILNKTGAIKFCNVQIDSLQAFQSITSSISDKFLEYIDGTSPRTKLIGNVYSSTEYDKTQKITMHNELSYSAKWPNKIFFSCLQVAERGGETLLADSREMLKKLDTKLVSEIEAKGIKYIRNLHGGNGIGASWQKTFETNDKNQVMNYCRTLNIDAEWRDDGLLRLNQLSKGIIRHRFNFEKLWFNQIDQFHPYQLGEEVYTAMLSIYDSPEDFPTYVTFGDGTKIHEDIIKEILSTAEEISLAPGWQKNELLMIDNELISHGRNPFTGNRKVIVSMSE